MSKFLIFVSVVLFVLQLCAVITVSWWLVALPAIVGVVIAGVRALIGLVILKKAKKEFEKRNGSIWDELLG